MDFEIIAEIWSVEVIAMGPVIRERARLRKFSGDSRWRKLKGLANVRLPSGSVHLPEIHRYRAHCIGKKEFNRKLPLLD